MCREGFFIEGVMDGGYPPDADSLFARARVDEDELLRVCSLRSQAFTNLVQVNMLFENYLLEDEIEKAKTKRCAATESPSESESLRLPYWNCPVP
jgi:hypothetical protein